MTRPIRCVLVGAGAWGRNILRVLQAHPDVHLSAIVDPCASVRASFLSLGVFPTLAQARLVCDFDAALIASPAATHAVLAAEMLVAGLHVFVEKPLTTDPVSADKLVRLARRADRVAMVGHLLRYHPAVRRLLQAVRDGAIGTLRSFTASRSSVGKSSDGSALWALGPHDLSVLHALDGSSPLLLSTTGQESKMILRVHLVSGVNATITLSRTSSQKVRRLILKGTDGSLFFDDTSATPTLTLVRRNESFDLCPRTSLAVPAEEPLAVEIDHFLQMVRTGGVPRTSFSDGAKVVQWLAKAERNSLPWGHESQVSLAYEKRENRADNPFFLRTLV